MSTRLDGKEGDQAAVGGKGRRGNGGRASFAGDDSVEKSRAVVQVLLKQGHARALHLSDGHCEYAIQSKDPVPAWPYPKCKCSRSRDLVLPGVQCRVLYLALVPLCRWLGSCGAETRRPYYTHPRHPGIYHDACRASNGIESWTQLQSFALSHIRHALSDYLGYRT